MERLLKETPGFEGGYRSKNQPDYELVTKARQGTMVI